MGSLYLISGYDKSKGFSRELLKYFNKELRNVKNVGFISSSPDNHDNNIKYIYGNGERKGIVEHLHKFCNPEYITIYDNDNKELNKIINSDLIVILGGNYETQLTYMKKNFISSLLKDYSGTIIAMSCGAMNIAKDAYYSKNEDIDKSFFYKGLNITDVTIDPHFDISNKDVYNDNIRMSMQHKIYGVPNESGLKITDGKIIKIGKIYEFNKGKVTED